MFAKLPVLNGSASEERVVNLSNVEEFKPNGNVTVDGSEVASCLLRFTSTETCVVLLDLTTIVSHVSAFAGVVDEFGSLS